MPQRDAGSPNNFTFINGNPRDKRNVTEIRRHAGKSSYGKNANSSFPNSFSRMLALAPPSTASFEENSPILLPNMNDPTPGVSRRRGLSIRDLVHDESDREQPGTQELSIPPLVIDENILSGSLSTMTAPHPTPLAVRPRRHQRQNSPPNPTSGSPVRTNVSKRRYDNHPAGRQWRVHIPPSRVIPLSDEQSNLERVLSQVFAFQTNGSASGWIERFQRSHSSSIIEDASVFCSSISVAADLIAAGRIETASEMLEKTLPALGTILLSQYQQLYWVVVEMTFSGSDTVLGRLQNQIRPYAAATSQRILGEHHPFTKLFKLNMSPEESSHLRALIEHRVYQSYVKLIPEGVQLPSPQDCFLALLLLTVDQGQLAANIVEITVVRFKQVFGIDPLMHIFLLLELCKILLKLFRLDAAESLATDAIQRLAEFRSEGLLSDACITQIQINYQRLLGRVHVLRGNHDMGMYYFAMAVDQAQTELGREAPMGQLAERDLEAARALAIQADAAATATECVATHAKPEARAAFTTIDIILPQ